MLYISRRARSASTDSVRRTDELIRDDNLLNLTTEYVRK